MDSEIKYAIARMEGALELLRTGGADMTPEVVAALTKIGTRCMTAPLRHGVPVIPETAGTEPEVPNGSSDG